MPTKLEYAARRKEIIEYYLNVANRSRKETADHYRHIIWRPTIYKILRKYEERREVPFKAKLHGIPSSIVTLENLRRYGELLKVNPRITSNEAAAALNLSKSAVMKVRKEFIKRNGDVDSDIPIDNRKPIPDYDRIVGVPGLASDMAQGESSQLLERKKKRCLICFEVDEEFGDSRSKFNELQSNLNMIFVFKILLGFTTEELVSTMKKSRNDPKDWVSICGKCSDLVERSKLLHAKIKKLEVELDHLKENVRETIRRNVTIKSRKICDEEVLLTTKTVRDLVKKKMSQTSTELNRTDFEEADKKAASMAQQLFTSSSPLILDGVVKVEPQEAETCSDSDDMETQTYADFENDPGPAGVEANSPNIESDDTEDSATNSNEASGNSTSKSLPDPDVICDVCGETMRPKALPIHKLRQHEIVTEGLEVLRCDADGCKYVTYNECNFTKHKKTHGSSRPYTCQYCGKSFVVQHYFAQHELAHENAETRPYQCQLCGKAFAVYSYLYAHMRNKHQDKSFPSAERTKKARDT